VVRECCGYLESDAVCPSCALDAPRGHIFVDIRRRLAYPAPRTPAAFDPAGFH